MNQVQNSVTLIGHIGQDPKSIKTKSDRTMTTFSLATNESYTKDGKKVTTTQWHNCQCFGKLGDTLVKYTKKGSQMAVMGKIIYNKYTDKNGIARVATNIEVNDFFFLDKKEE